MILKVNPIVPNVDPQIYWNTTDIPYVAYVEPTWDPFFKATMDPCFTMRIKAATHTVSATVPMPFFRDPVLERVLGVEVTNIEVWCATTNTTQCPTKKEVNGKYLNK